MTPAETKRIIDKLGIKMYHLSTICGVHPVYLSRYFKNKYTLPPDKKQKLESCLMRIKEAMSYEYND